MSPPAADTARPSADLQLEQALGHGVADKRIDILRRVAELGSISGAARATGVSYKAAWQALETLGNLAGAPMVHKAVGGSGGGGARLTEAGRLLLDGAALFAASRSATAQRLNQRGSLQGPAIQAPGVAALGLRTSMRNQLVCQIGALKRDGALLRVLLDLGAGQSWSARITRESAQLLELRPGLQVLALCKATAVTVAVAPTSTQPGQAGTNLLQGQVTRLPTAQRAGEVSLQLASGQQLVGFALADHGLRKGQGAVARVDESGVVIALAV